MLAAGTRIGKEKYASPCTAGDITVSDSVSYELLYSEHPATVSVCKVRQLT